MFIFIFVLVQTIITLTFMIMVGGWVNQIRPLKFQIIFIKLLKSRTAAFLLNMFISSILAGFTGAGMYAGFANLTSSVLVAAIAYPVLDFKFKFSITEATVRNEAIVKKTFGGRLASMFRTT